MAVAVISVSARCSSKADSVVRDKRLESRAASFICTARSLRRVRAVFSRASSLIRINCNCAAGPSASLKVSATSGSAKVLPEHRTICANCRPRR
ncbi:hypothetical protein D3C78_1307020 [compost metagenome]